jgi:hypothetical protein
MRRGVRKAKISTLFVVDEERKRVLSEYSFLSYFGPFTEKW